MTHSARLRTTVMRLDSPESPGRAFVEWELRTGLVAECIDVVVDDRRQGVGSSLVTEMCRMLRTSGVRTVYAWTRASNVVARAFWYSCGFSHVTVVEGFYGDALTDVERAGVLLVKELG